jgi:hypothetical protein
MRDDGSGYCNDSSGGVDPDRYITCAQCGCDVPETQLHESVAGMCNSCGELAALSGKCDELLRITEETKQLIQTRKLCL